MKKLLWKDFLSGNRPVWRTILMRTTMTSARRRGKLSSICWWKLVRMVLSSQTPRSRSKSILSCLKQVSQNLWLQISTGFYPLMVSFFFSGTRHDRGCIQLLLVSNGLPPRDSRKSYPGTWRNLWWQWQTLHIPGHDGDEISRAMPHGDSPLVSTRTTDCSYNQNRLETRSVLEIKSYTNRSKTNQANWRKLQIHNLQCLSKNIFNNFFGETNI